MKGKQLKKLLFIPLTAIAVCAFVATLSACDEKRFARRLNAIRQCYLLKRGAAPECIAPDRRDTVWHGDVFQRRTTPECAVSDSGYGPYFFVVKMQFCFRRKLYKYARKVKED